LGYVVLSGSLLLLVKLTIFDLHNNLSMKRILITVLIAVSAVAAVAQGNMNTRKWRKTELDSLGKAQLLFEEQNFQLSYPIYNELQKNHPKELYLKYVTGIAGLYRSDLHAQSLEFLLQVYEKNRKAADIEFDLARAYHYNYKFDEALALLQNYLKNTKLPEKQRTRALQLSDYCQNAKLLVASPVNATIENLGDIVNTVSSEYVPVVSSDESVMIFTYVGDQSTGGRQNAYNQPDSLGIFYEDVFITHKEGDSWVVPSSAGTNINTSGHDAAIAISNDGQKLFIFKDDRYDGGDIYISTLENGNWSVPEKLKGDVNTPAWEGSASLSADEKTLYFTSEMPSGFGGRDLYKATLDADGRWGNIKNLGPKINTALDDDAPFIHPDGHTLIFSSKALNSMGDYDIFVSRYSTVDSSWSTPENLGYPVNTPDDDRYLVLSANGERGYYASGKAGGFGLQDIYVVDMPDNFNRPVVAMVNGKITLDDKPVNALISVKVDGNKPLGEFHSSSTDGDYLVNLEPGHTYKISYSLAGHTSQEEELDITTLKEFLNKTINIKFLSKKDTVPVKDSVAIVVKDTVAAPAKTGMDGVVDRVGNSSKEGLEFKVQIAAYNLPKNYNAAHLKGLGKIEKLLLEDGITRFTIGGSFKTLNDAIAHKDKVKAAGQSDAFVTAIYLGKRVYLEELEKIGLIPAQK
jgi:hypothetical protein